MARRRRTSAPDMGLGSSPKLPVVATRWVLIIGISYTILFGSRSGAPLWPHQTIVLALLGSNLALHLMLRWGMAWRRLRWVFACLDVAVVTLSVTLLDGDSSDLYLVYFAVLLLATVIPKMSRVAALTLLGGAAYAGLLYFRYGDDLWYETELLVRLPFLFGIALYFGSVVQEARMEHARGTRLEEEARHIAKRAKALAKEQYRLQSLAEIGRLGLSGVRSEPGKILFEIIQRVQRVVGVDRCSLVIFERDGGQAYVAASGDDPSVEVRVLALEEYPELRAMLSRGEITELYPGEPAQLWSKVQKCLPSANPFRAFLIVPIQRGNRLLGAFYLRDVRSNHRYTEEDRSFCWTAAMMTAAFIHGQDLLDQLRTQSRRDGLTGLLNFQAFQEEAAVALDEAGEHGEKMSLVVADLDNLKEMNDRFGHAAGNRLIITAGHAFATVLSDSSTICRYGGDEFCGLVKGDKDLTRRRLERFLSHLDDNDAELPKPPRVSVGVAEFPTDGHEADELLDAADQAMYLAKNDGGHQIYLAGEREAGMDTEEYQRAVLEAVVQVQARRYMPDEDVTLQELLEPLADAEGQNLDSPLVRDTLEVLMSSVESKDPFTRAHSEAVSRLAGKLAEAMKFPHDEQTAIEIAGLVHDVGKIGVPEEILTKEGKLTSVERQVMQRHPEIAAELLSQIPPLRPVVPLVYHHQERWDGSGYPGGLKGEEIPPGAMVVALCDAYDALTSARAFRSALSPEEARRVLERDSGRLWNPEIVRVFLDDVLEQDGQVEKSVAS